MSEERLREITVLVAECRSRLSPERAFLLLRAAEELLRAVPRQGRLIE